MNGRVDEYGCDAIMCPIDLLLSSTGGEGVSVDCDQDYCDKIRWEIEVIYFYSIQLYTHWISSLRIDNKL